MEDREILTYQAKADGILKMSNTKYSRQVFLFYKHGDIK
jgi:hypothetical protein